MEDVGAGYPLTADDYMNDVSGRSIIDLVMEVASAACREAIEQAVTPIDARFMAATRVPPRGDPWGRGQDRWFRYPLKLVGELAGDFQRFVDEG